MKVEVNSQALADAVAWTTRVIDARPATPILAGIRLEAIDGTLQLSAFNYAISARHHIEAGVDEDSPTFAQAVNQASVAVSREENRPVLTGIRVQFQGDKVIMSSTDRFRLARSSFTWTPEDATISTTALVRGSLLRDMARSLDEHQNVTIDFDADNPSLLGFENAGRVSTSQLIDGEFPAVDRLYADEYPIHAVINKQALIDAIKRVSLVAERNAPIRMVFSGQELTLSAGTADEAQAKEILDIDMDGEDITVAFNPSYLVDGLSAISEPFVRMKMTTAVKPVEFNGQQEADSDESMDYRYLLVPMRFNN